MKRIIIYLTLIIIFSFLGIIGFINRPSTVPNKEILSRIFYNYNLENSTYTEIFIDEKEISSNDVNFLPASCKKYSYLSNTSIVKMDCGLAFRIVSSSQNGLVINKDNKNYYFLETEKLAYDREFSKIYGKNIEEYKKEGLTKLENIKIDEEKLEELISADEFNFVYIKNDKCDNKCMLISNIIDKLSGNKEIYYIEKRNITKDIILNNEKFLKLDESDEPIFIVIGKDKVKDVINIKIDTIDVSFLSGYLDDFQYIDEEDLLNEGVENE